MAVSGGQFGSHETNLLLLSHDIEAKSKGKDHAEHFRQDPGARYAVDLADDFHQN